MTAELNPFLAAHWHGFPMRPLRPWKHAAHRDYYVPVDNSEKAFHKVTQEMEHVDTLVEGRCDNRRRGVRLDDRRQAYHQLVEHAASGSITIDWQPLPLERAGQA
jgi:hypothetical protein